MQSVQKLCEQGIVQQLDPFEVDGAVEGVQGRALVVEQKVQLFFGHEPAADDVEGIVGLVAVEIHLVGQKLFFRTRLAGDEHVGAGLGHDVAAVPGVLAEIPDQSQLLRLLARQIVAVVNLDAAGTGQIGQARPGFLNVEKVVGGAQHAALAAGNDHQAVGQLLVGYGAAACPHGGDQAPADGQQRALFLHSRGKGHFAALVHSQDLHVPGADVSLEKGGLHLQAGVVGAHGHHMVQCVPDALGAGGQQHALEPQLLRV